MNKFRLLGALTIIIIIIGVGKIYGQENLALSAISKVIEVSNNYELEDAVKRPNSIFMEFGGLGIGMSVNYDTRFGARRNGLGGLVGLGMLIPIPDSGTGYTVPLSLNYLFGNKKDFFEIGLGGTYVNSTSNPFSDDEESKNASSFGQTLSLMYRKQPIDKGFMFRGGLTPTFADGNFYPAWFSLSFGYTF
ncbi:MAG: hypothetical protein NWQ38_01975 [Cellulophaga sp.]|nr:hypothetical protein [Cellulophaga sp.]